MRDWSLAHAGALVFAAFKLDCSHQLLEGMPETRVLQVLHSAVHAQLMAQHPPQRQDCWAASSRPLWQFMISFGILKAITLMCCTYPISKYVLSCESGQAGPSHPASRHDHCWTLQHHKLTTRPQPCNHLANTSLLPPAAAELDEHLEPYSAPQPQHQPPTWTQTSGRRSARSAR